MEPMIQTMTAATMMMMMTTNLVTVTKKMGTKTKKMGMNQVMTMIEKTKVKVVLTLILKYLLVQ